MDKFIEARRAYQQLQSQYSANKIDKAAFQQAVEQLAVQDPFGDLWQIGVTSGNWYRFDGREWVEDYPPPPNLGATQSAPADDDQTAVKISHEMPPPAAAWHILIESGAASGKRIAIDRELILGRDSNNNVYLNDKQCSRKHALIQRSDQDYLLTDQNSTNGTELNGRRIQQPARLKHGDRVRIGDTFIRVEGDSATVPAMAESRAPRKAAPPPPLPPQPAYVPPPLPTSQPAPPPAAARPAALRPAPIQQPKKRRSCLVPLLILVGILGCLAVFVVGAVVLMPNLIPDNLPGITFNAKANLEIQNLTDVTICYIYISPATAAHDMGENVLGPGETFPASTYISYTLEANQSFDIFVEDCNGNVFDAQWDVYVPAEGTTIYFSSNP